MIQVSAYSRLHFGLLNPTGREVAALATPGWRGFGGVGLMIGAPRLSLRVEPASAWSAEGPLGERALTCAQRFAAACCADERMAALPPHRLGIDHVMPAHAGLGSGTQLALAIGRALAASWGLSCDLATLARRVGRGVRSALGVHGFALGGFLVESGKRVAENLAPLAARQPFPEAWHLVLALPIEGQGARGAAGLHGRDEAEAFARLTADPRALQRTERLCRLVLLGLLPALVECDLDAFGEALYEFNVHAGEAFAPVQGGVYASPQTAALVEFVRGQAVRGVGQSSWGPAMFAVVADAEHAAQLAAKLRKRFALPDTAVWTTTACNHGATIANEPPKTKRTKKDAKDRRGA